VRLERSRSKALGRDLKESRSSLRKSESELSSTKERNRSIASELDLVRVERERLEAEVAEKAHSASLLEKRTSRA